MPCRRGDRSRRFRLRRQRTRLLHAGQPPRCGQLPHGPAHADTRCRAVVPQRCPRLSDIHRKPLPGYVLVPHPARRQASRRGEKSQVWLSRPPYMFFPFSSPIDLEELMCRRSQELRKRQVENSPLLAILALCRETELGQRDAFVTSRGRVQRPFALISLSKIAAWNRERFPHTVSAPRGSHLETSGVQHLA